MKKIFFCLLFFFSTYCLFSQSLLWKISGKHLEHPSYLYGSIHIQDERVFAFDSVVWNAFNSCDAFAMEVLLDEVNPKELRAAMYMPKGKTLSGMMSKEDFHLLDSIFRKATGTSVMFCNTLKPFFISSSMLQSSLRQDKNQALDMFLLDTARKVGKKCYGVEKLQTQIDAIDAISLKEQIRILSEALHKDYTDTNQTNIEFDNLLNAYLEADFDKIFDLTKDESLPKKFNQVFLVDRNIGMAKSLIHLMSTQSVFCTVGAAHLAGKKGVINILRKKGYIVEPIPFKWL